MSIFNHGRYTINCADKPYINAIATYNQKSLIKTIQYGSQPKQSINMYIDQLPTLVSKAEAAQEDIFTIEYGTTNANSLYKVFPEMIATEKQKKLASQQCSFASRYFDEEILSATDCAEVQYGNGEKPKSLTKEEALALALGTPDCSGAIELPELNTILVHIYGAKSKSACFYIKYGEDCSINSMNLFLDLDDGFFCDTKKDSHPDKIVQNLQVHFNTWKYSHYQDPLFPKETALNFTRDGLILTPPTIEPLSRFGGRGLSFFCPGLSKHHVTYYGSLAANESDHFQKVIEILKDYDKSNSFFGAFLGRVIHGAWNRSHLEEVDQIINGNCRSVAEILTRLDEIPLANKQGALARRIEFIRTNFVGTSENNQQRSTVVF
ncbi:MAG: DUF5617 domain-containing protein [Tatlockia sp.]|nr:DUF5617 domain-containing protein [Tatlockia sp.]